MRIEFKEPTLFEYLLYDLERYNTKSLREKIAVCGVFAIQPLNQAMSYHEMERTASEFEKFMGCNVLQFRR